MLRSPDENARPADEPVAHARLQTPDRVPLALWASGDGIFEWQAATGLLTIEHVDPGATGDSPALVAERLSIEALIARTHVDDQASLRRVWDQHLRGQVPVLDLSFRNARGQRWWRVRGRSLDRDASGGAVRVLGTLRDVTAQHAAESLLRLMGHAFASTREPMALVDAQGRVLDTNPALRRLCADPALQCGADLQRWLGPLLPLFAQVLRDSVWQGERSLCPAAAGGDGGPAPAPAPVELSITAVEAEPPMAGRCFLVALHDLRERRRVEARLQQLAMIDPASGLPNRLAAQQQLAQRLAVSDRAAAAMGLLFADLDGFKEINESHGHAVGDELLAAVGERLRGALAADVFVARWASAGFALLLPPGSGDTEVRAAAQSVLAALASPFVLAELEMSVAPTLGAVLSPQHGSDLTTLVRKAELAVHAGRDTGQQFVLFESALDDVVQRRVRMTSLLRIDAERNGFHFVAQPKVDARGVPLGAELLMRWQTEAYGAVSPVEFIPLAEKVGLIQMMGRQAAQAAAQLAGACADAGCPLPVAVNLAARQLQQPGLDGLLLAACRRHGVPPKLLELELTESALVHNLESVKPLLHRLRDLGFGLALDDFGTGYSSLSYLRHLPFDKVKIDRSFVMDVDRDPSAARMLESIVQLCEAQGMRVVAEGVETAQQLAMLAAMGVHEFQGYHFARPMPVADWLALLAGSAVAPLRLPRVDPADPPS